MLPYFAWRIMHEDKNKMADQKDVDKLRDMIRVLTIERDELEQVLGDLLNGFKRIDDGSYMQLSEGYTQYNIKKAHEVLNKYKFLKV